MPKNIQENYGEMQDLTTTMHIALPYTKKLVQVIQHTHTDTYKYTYIKKPPLGSSRSTKTHTFPHHHQTSCTRTFLTLFFCLLFRHWVGEFVRIP